MSVVGLSVAAQLELAVAVKIDVVRIRTSGGI